VGQQVSGGRIHAQLADQDLSLELERAHFRNCHLPLSEHSEQIFSITDPLGGRARKIRETMLLSIGHTARLKRIAHNDAEYCEPKEMLAESRDHNEKLVAGSRGTNRIVSAAQSAMLRPRVCPMSGLTRPSGAPSRYLRQHEAQQSARIRRGSPMRVRREVWAAVVSLFLFGVTARAQEADNTESSQISVDPNTTNASNNPLTPRVTLQPQNFAMPVVQGHGGRWSDEELVRLYVPFHLGDTLAWLWPFRLRNMLR
jgi:hypothetical protein